MSNIFCISRELNPSLFLGRELFYHYTTNAWGYGIFIRKINHCIIILPTLLEIIGSNSGDLYEIFISINTHYSPNKYRLISLSLFLQLLYYVFIVKE